MCPFLLIKKLRSCGHDFCTKIITIYIIAVLLTEKLRDDAALLSEHFSITETVGGGVLPNRIAE